MLKVLLSPAKKLNLTADTALKKTSPIFIKQAQKLNAKLKNQSPKDLMKLMKLSQKLGDLNWKRNQNWNSEGNTAAGFMFDGEVYRGLLVKTMPENQLKIAQEKLYLLSGLYGVLKPLDAIEAYRLEMGTKFGVEGAHNLYEFWEEKITQQINKELGEGTLVNLASDEYSKVINRKKLKATVVTCYFKDYKDEQLKTIIVYTKKARGMMARYIVEENITRIEDLKKFNAEKYAFDSNLSTETDFVFTR